MKFELHCPRCNKQLSLDEEYAGQTVECPDCHRLLEVPSVEPSAAVPAAAPGAAGRGEPSRPAPGGKSRWLRVLAAGVVAALATGGLWAVLGIWTEREYGILALLVGVAVGWAVRLAGGRGWKRFALLAALLAAVGIVFGKALIVEHVLDQAGGTMQTMRLLGEALSGDIREEHLAAYLKNKLESGGELPNPMVEVDRLNGEGVDPESVRYRNAVAAAEKRDAANQAEAEKRCRALSPEAKKQLADEIVGQQLLSHYMQKLIDDGTLKFTMSEDELLEKVESANEADGRKLREQYLRESERNQAEAKRRLEQLSPEEKTALLEESREMVRNEMNAFRQSCRMEVFKGMFNLLDLAFFLVALIAAWEIVFRANREA